MGAALETVDVIGGGPGGLSAAALLKQLAPEADVVVSERNPPYATFGFGVVFSAATMRGLAAAAPAVHAALSDQAVSWDAVELRLHGDVHRCGGNRMSAIARRELLAILERWAVERGVAVRHRAPRTDLVAGADLTVVASGARSEHRDRAAAELGATWEDADARFIWCGTEAPFDGLTFPFVPTRWGVFGAHAYPIGGGFSTFIVECDAATWRAAGLDAFDADQPPGPSDDASLRVLAEIFGEHLDGRPLLGNNSRRSPASRRRHSGAVR